MFNVSGKVAIITGGSQGIGEAIARKFLEAELKGIAILARCKEKGLRVVDLLNKEFGEGRAIFIQTDVSDKKQFDDAFKKTLEVFKNIDILVNNASIHGDADWEKLITANMTGTVIGTMLAFENYIPRYSSGEGGAIINISSLAALGCPSLPVYSASKLGTLALTSSLGSDLHYNRTKIKVIAICVGYTDTPAIIVHEKLFISPVYYKIHMELTKTFSSNLQPPSAVSAALLTLVKESHSGSIWVVKNNQPPYEVKVVLEAV